MLAAEADQLRAKSYASCQEAAKSKKDSRTENQVHTGQDSRQGESYVRPQRKDCLLSKRAKGGAQPVREAGNKQG